MAHPSRIDNVNQTLSKLSLQEDIVSWDDRENGGDAIYTAHKAWTSPIPSNATHRLVLQDDIEICNDFITIAEMVADKHNNQVVSFFHCEEYPENSRYNKTQKIWGCAVMLPIHMVKPCWDFIEYMKTRPEIYNECYLKHDTVAMRMWAEKHEISVINTSPSLVQHIGDISLVGNEKRRIAPDYCENPPLFGW